LSLYVAFLFIEKACRQRIPSVFPMHRIPSANCSLTAVLAALLVVAAASLPAELSNIPNEAMWSTDGDVRAILVDGNTIYIGGIFSRVGPVTGGGVPIGAESGLPEAAYPKVTGFVSAVVPDGLGGWYIGGDFTRVGRSERNRLAHILPDGSLDPLWNPSPWGDNISVSEIVVSGSTVYVAGRFTGIGGAERQNIAALDALTGLSTAWNPGANGPVYALAVSGSTVYVGGLFTGIGGAERQNIAALEATTGLATAWNPGANGGVSPLAVSGSTVYVGGLFTSIGGAERQKIAALDATTGLATAWNPGLSGDGFFPYVWALAVSGSTVYVGGQFTGIGGADRQSIAALDATTGLATAWNPGLSGDGFLPFVSALAISGSTVYVGGQFTGIGGAERHNIGALDATTGLATTWNPSAGGGVYALAISGSSVYAGGRFESLGGVERQSIAALDATTGLPTAWNPGLSGDQDYPFVSALAISGSTVYVGGQFTGIGGADRQSIAALDATTGLATPWNPGASEWAYVFTLAVTEATVYAGGEFSSIGGAERYFIAALGATTGLATAWNPDANEIIDNLAVSGSTVYAVGSFTRIGGAERNYIAALDATTGLATAWDPNASGEVVVLAVSGSTVYVGGAFDSIGGAARNNIAALDAASGLATPWDPSAGGNFAFVSALMVSGPTIYVGGQFTSIGGAARRNNAALDATTGLATAWNPSPNSGARVFAISGSTVFAGGSFSTLGGRLDPARFDDVEVGASVFLLK